MARTPPQALFAIPSAEDIASTALRIIQEDRILIDDLVKSVTAETATAENVLLPILALENAQSGAYAMIYALQYCSPHKTTRDAVQQAKNSFDRYWSEVSSKLYVLLKAVQLRSTPDAEHKKILEDKLLQYERRGYGVLTDDAVSRRGARLRKINDLCGDFHRTLREVKTGEWFTTSQLTGVLQKDRVDPVDGKA